MEAMIQAAAVFAADSRARSVPRGARRRRLQGLSRYFAWCLETYGDLSLAHLRAEDICAATVAQQSDAMTVFDSARLFWEWLAHRDMLPPPVDVDDLGTTFVDLEGTVLLVDWRAAAIFGFRRPEEMVGLSVFSLALPEHVHRIAQGIRILGEGEPFIPITYPCYRSDGQLIPVGFLSSRVIRDDFGKPFGLLTHFREMPEMPVRPANAIVAVA